MSDKLAVVELRERAQQLMEAAEAAAAKGVLCSETTVLVRHDGSIHMAMDSDWPLESLRADRGADTAYRVVVNAGKISVEACDLRHRICIQVATTRKIARALLEAQPALLAASAAPAPESFLLPKVLGD